MLDAEVVSLREVVVGLDEEAEASSSVEGEIASHLEAETLSHKEKIYVMSLMNNQ